MTLFPVLVTCRKAFAESEQKKIKAYGLDRIDRCTFSGNLNQKAYTSLRDYCTAHHISIRITNPFGTRGNGYRRKFFDTYPPFIGGFYICAYCGRPVWKDHLTIDHLYPVGKIKRSAVLQKRLMKMGYESVNDVRNLVPSCSRCNNRKAAKMGIWIIKGNLGRHPWVWVIRHIIRISLLWAVFLAVSSGMYKSYIDMLLMRFPQLKIVIECISYFCSLFLRLVYDFIKKYAFI